MLKLSLLALQVGTDEEDVGSVRQWCQTSYSGPCLVDVVCDSTSGRSSVKLLRHILPNIGGCENVVVIAGDVLTNVSLRTQLMTHSIAGAALTVLVGSTVTSQMAMKGSQNCPTEFLSLRDDGTIAVYCHAQDKMRDVRLSEACLCKYTNLTIQKGLSDMRTYVFRYEALKYILSANTSLLDIQKHLVPYMVRYQLVSNQSSSSTRLLDRTSSTNLTLSGSSSNARLASCLGSSEETPGYDVVAYTAPRGSHCIRVSSPGSYADANRDVVSPDLASSYLEDAPNARGDAFIATGVEIGNKVTIAGGSMVGKGSVLGDRCSIKRSVVGECCTVGPGSKIINSVIQNGVLLGDGCHIQNSIICSGSKLVGKVALKDCLVGTSALVEAGDYKSEEIFQD